MEITEYVIIIAAILASLILIIYFRSLKKQVKISYFITGITLVLCSQVVTLAGSQLGDTPEGIIISQFTMVFFSFGIIFVFLHYETLVSPHPNYPLLLLHWSISITILVSWAVLPFQYYLMKIPIQTDNIYNISFWEMSLSTTKFALSFNLFLGLFQFDISFIRNIKTLSKIHGKSKNNSVNMERNAMWILLIYRNIFIISLLLPLQSGRMSFLNIISAFALVLSIIGLLMLMFNYIVHPDYLYYLPFPIHSIMIYNSSGLLIYERKVDVEKITNEDTSVLMTGTLTAIQMMVHEVLGNGSKLKFIDAGYYKILFASLPFDKAVISIITRQDTQLFQNSIKRFTQNVPQSILDQIEAIADLTPIQKPIDELIKGNFPYIQFK